jgi:hypothetical protein
MVNFNLNLKSILLIFILGFVFNLPFKAFAQPCAGNHAIVSIENLIQTASNKIELDIYIKNTGTNILCLGALTGGFTYDTLFENGGTITGVATLIGGFSGLNTCNVAVQPATRQVRWSQTPTSGVCIPLSGPGSTAVKHHYLHMVLTNTVPFSNCFALNLVWNLNLPATYSSVIALVYCNGNSSSQPLLANGTVPLVTCINPPTLYLNCCPTGLTPVITNTCPGTSDGDAVITVVGPSTNSAGKYTLNGGVLQPYAGGQIGITGLAAGTYTIAVTDTFTVPCSPISTTFAVGNLPVQTPVSNIVTACDNYTWATNVTTYSSSGTYTATYPDLINGCNVTDTLHLTITPTSNPLTTITACATYTWPINGITYTNSGNYSYISGCVNNTLNLVIIPNTSSSTSNTSCDSYTWPANGVTYSTSGIYTNVVACNTQMLNLTITPSSTVVATQNTCGSYLWPINGNTYTTSGTYFATVGCITHQLILTLLPITTNTTTLVKCVTYTWPINGITYTSSGVYTFQNGCTIEQLNLTIQPKIGTVVTSDTGCNYYIWYPNAQMYTQNGTYYWYNPSCVEYVLNLVISTTTSQAYNVNSVGPYYWPLTGLYYANSGQYTNTGSICHVDTLNLTVLPTSVDNLQVNNSILEISPNPTSDRIRVKLSKYDPSNVVVKLLDITGRLINEQSAMTVSGNNVFEFQMGSLANGVYAIQVIEDGKLVHINKVQKTN